MRASISILVANYNNGHFFSEMYQSLIAQTEPNWEAIVIDDASTDNSVALIKSVIKDDKRVRFYQNEKNLGYQNTIVRAIGLSTAEIFGRLDPDDMLAPEAIEKSVEIHDKFPAVGLVYSNIIYCDPLLNPVKVLKGQQIDELNETYYNLHGAIWPFSTFKRKFYDLTEGVDTFNRRAEDQDIYMKMCEVAPVKYLDFNTYFYRVHKNAISTMENKDRSFFWHWVAIMKTAERNGANLEDHYLKYFTDRKVLAGFQERRVSFFKTFTPGNYFGKFVKLFKR